MNDPMTVTPHEHGTLRVFALDMDADTAKALDLARLGQMIGAAPFDASKPEIVAKKFLGEMTITQYLQQGYGIPASDLTANEARLNADDAVLALVPASAFEGAAQSLTLSPEVQMIGAYREAPAAPHEVTAPLSSDEDASPASPTAGAEGKSGLGSLPVAGIVAGVVVLLLLLLLIF